MITPFRRSASGKNGPVEILQALHACRWRRGRIIFPSGGIGHKHRFDAPLDLQKSFNGRSAEMNEGSKLESREGAVNGDFVGQRVPLPLGSGYGGLAAVCGRD